MVLSPRARRHAATTMIIRAHDGHAARHLNILAHRDFYAPLCQPPAMSRQISAFRSRFTPLISHYNAIFPAALSTYGFDELQRAAQWQNDFAISPALYLKMPMLPKWQ